MYKSEFSEFFSQKKKKYIWRSFQRDRCKMVTDPYQLFMIKFKKNLFAFSEKKNITEREGSKLIYDF